jgi:hypothetical protein
MFTSTALEKATKGHDLARVIKALDSVGALEKKNAGRSTYQVRTSEGPKKFYCIAPWKLEKDIELDLDIGDETVPVTKPSNVTLLQKAEKK